MATIENINIEAEQLRERYRIEREKRLLSDGHNQYLEPTGRFAHLLEDPYSKLESREPFTNEVTVAIIGGGFAGLSAGARLKQAGIEDVMLIESGGDVGGVWYWNRYPGAMCDTAAMVYLPLLEETNYFPSKKYVQGYEIHAHAQRIATTFGLYDNALFSTKVEDLSWNEDLNRWVIKTNRGDAIKAQFVAMGTGPMHHPKLPGISGIEDFKGHMFHTARWDYEYTGGDRTGEPLDGLSDKRVGIIGTGATAVQCIPHLAASAGDLFVFQRTPSSIDIRNNRSLTDEDFADLDEGWQREWLINFATLQAGGFADADLVKDGWTDIAIRIRDRIVQRIQDNPGSGIEDVWLDAFAESDDEKMNEIRARVDSVISDQTTAEALKPWYRQLCKRPCFHDEYLQSFNNPNTHLVDTDGQGVQKIDETGVWVGGDHYELDCIILASGFEVHIVHSAHYETKGRNGKTLEEHWEGGMKSLHGINIHGFPNLFILGLAQGGSLVANVTHNFTESASAISAMVGKCIQNGSETIEPTAEAEMKWVNRLEVQDRGFLANCTPGYYNNEGSPASDRDLFSTARYPEGPVAFFEYLHDWVASGQFEGLEFSPPPAS
ncbi:MAG: monooxygenase [Acidimicrobiaceae bacterium]|nr:monooxygenase [Acidimicrobiaceae bacterium]